MSISDDKWFEIWFSHSVDVIPACLYVVTPDPQKARIRCRHRSTKEPRSRL